MLNIAVLLIRRRFSFMLTAWKRVLIIVLVCVCRIAGACAETLEPLQMDSNAIGPAPKDAAYISDTEYRDASISVKIYYGNYEETEYVCAHIKISDPSQLRTASANGYFANNSHSEFRGSIIAENVNAVVAINGDYYTKSDQCLVVMRQCKQIRNKANGTKDLLLIDKQGNFSVLPNSPRDADSYVADKQGNWSVQPGCTAADYKAYLQAHQDEMYQVFCFGPVLVQNGESVISTDYLNKYIGSYKHTQRTAIAQLGPLEYMVVACSGPQSGEDVGLTIFDFASLCELLGKQLSENGCILAYNMDGGNSAELIFKGPDKNGNLKYMKMNSTDVGERDLSDIIYFATLVK